MTIMMVIILIGCESAPIEPKIIGTTFLQEEKGLIFADFDTMRYVPTIIYTGEKLTREDLKPVAGLQVTCFISNIHKDPVFFVGKVTTEQIEAYYHQNWTALLIFGIVILLVIIFCIIYYKNNTIEVRIVEAHPEE